MKNKRFMWIFVLFDLPTKTKDNRKNANRFRNYLLKDGYMMIQFSVYARICNGQDKIEKHMQRLQQSLPPEGGVRAIQITDKQYGRMKILVGKRVKNEEKEQKQLYLF